MMRRVALVWFAGTLAIAKAEVGRSLQALEEALNSDRLPEASNLLEDVYGSYPLTEIGEYLLRNPIRMTTRKPLDGIDRVLGGIHVETACTLEQLVPCQEAIFFLTRFAPRGAYQASW